MFKNVEKTFVLWIYLFDISRGTRHTCVA